MARYAGAGVAGLAAFSAIWVLAYRFVDPPGTLLMIGSRLRLGAVEQEWRPLERISAEMRLAAISAEDARFCAHWGFDFKAIGTAFDGWREGGRLRGASTISQQTAKNLFLWPARSWLRKGLEAWFTLLMETLWPKRRILEMYLNVAEFGDGVFGVEAAARRWYGVSADALGFDRAARLMVTLPAPRRRDPNYLSADMSAAADRIARRAGTGEAKSSAACARAAGERERA